VPYLIYHIHEKGYKAVELRAYVNILWRRIWVIALVVGVVALYVGYQYYHLRKEAGALKVYQSAVSFQVGLQESIKATDQSYSDYITISETLADTFVSSPSPILSSAGFDTQVVQQIQADMPLIMQRYGANVDLGDWKNTGAIGQSLVGTRAHSIVMINVNWNTAAGAWAIAHAAGEVSIAHIGTYVDYVVASNPSHASDPKLIQPPVEARLIADATDAAQIPGPQANRPTLLLVLLFVALIIGIALALLVEYLDDRIRRASDVTQLLQLPIYGEVPHAPAVGQGKAHSVSS
jgi:capsular polysaccharide biosynthesis protein